MPPLPPTPPALELPGWGHTMWESPPHAPPDSQAGATGGRNTRLWQQAWGYEPLRHHALAAAPPIPGCRLSPSRFPGTRRRSSTWPRIRLTSRRPPSANKILVLRFNFHVFIFIVLCKIFFNGWNANKKRSAPLLGLLPIQTNKDQKLAKQSKSNTILI
jgi:hypothetical protein